MAEDKDPFSEFGGSQTQDPFAEFGGESVKKKVGADVSTTPVSQDSKPSSQSFDFGELAPVEEKVKTTTTEFTPPTAQQDVLKEKPAPVEFESDVEKIKKLRNKQFESKLAYDKATKEGNSEAALKATVDADNYKKQADEVADNYAKQHGYNGTKLGLFDTFMNSMNNTVEGMDFGMTYMQANPEQRAKLLKDRYEKNQAIGLQPKEGVLGTVAQVTGGLLPFVGVGAATGGFGELPALIAGAGSFGLSEIGAKADEGYAKAKEEGKTDEEATDIATEKATFGAGEGVLLGGALHGVGGKELPKTFMDWMEKAAKKNATIGSLFSGAQLAENMFDKYRGRNVGITDNVLKKGVEGFTIGILTDGLHKMGESFSLPEKEMIQNVIAYTNPDAAIIGVNKAVDAGKMTRAEANSLIVPIAEKAKVFNQLPEVPFEKATEVAPHVEKIDKLNKDLENASPALKSEIERQIKEETMQVKEKLSTPLTDEEKVAHFELGEKSREGKLNPIEKRDLEHYQTRIDKIKEEKKAEKELKKQKNDTENKTGLPSEVGIGQESIETKPVESGSDQEVNAGGDVQTHEEEVKPVEEKIPDTDLTHSEAVKFLDDHVVQDKIDTYGIRPDFGMSSSELEIAMRHIREGKLDGVSAKKMLGKINEWKKQGYVDLIHLKGGTTVRLSAPYEIADALAKLPKEYADVVVELNEKLDSPDFDKLISDNYTDADGNLNREKLAQDLADLKNNAYFGDLLLLDENDLLNLQTYLKDEKSGTTTKIPDTKSEGKIAYRKKSSEEPTADYKTLTEPVEMPDGEAGLRVTIEKPNGEKVELGNMYAEDVEKETAKKIRGFKLSETKPSNVSDRIKNISKSLKVDSERAKQIHDLAVSAKDYEDFRNKVVGLIGENSVNKNRIAEEYNDVRQESKSEYEKELDRHLEDLREAYSDVSRTEAGLRKLQEKTPSRISGFVKRLLTGTTPEDVVASKARLAEMQKQYRKEKADLRALLPRERGSNFVVEKLSKAVRNGEISQETADLAIDLIKRQPNLFEDLAISITKKPSDNEGVQGWYRSADALVKVFKNPSDPTTAVHEVLHHTERFLPHEIRDNIIKEWNKEVELQKADLAKKLKNETDIGKRQEITTGLLYLELAQARQTEPNASNVAAMEGIMSKYLGDHTDSQGNFHKGLGNSWYQLFNPSEWWAVNASKLFREAKNKPELKTWTDKAKAFYNYLIESAKRIFKGSPTEAVEKGLKAVLNGETLEDREGSQMSTSKKLLNIKQGGTFDEQLKSIYDKIKKPAEVIEEKIETPTEDLTGKEIVFPHAGSNVKGTVVSVDGNGNYKVKGSDGIKKTILTKRAYEGEFREGVKKELERIGLTRDIENQKEAKGKAKEFIESVGEDVALEAVRNSDVSDAAGAYIWNELIESVDKKISTEKDPAKIAELEAMQANLIEEFGRKALSGGRFASALNDIYQSSDLGYNLQKKISDYKAQNGGEIPAEVEARFREYDKQLKDINERLAEAEKRAKEAEEKAAMDNIKEEVEREKKKARPVVYGKKRIAKGLDDLASALGAKLSAQGDEAVKVTDALAEIGKGLIEEGIATTENVWEKVKEYVADKFGDKVKDIDRYETNVKSGIAGEKTQGKIKISKSLIRELVSNGITDINELVSAVKERIAEEYPNATEREIRDAITGYGKVSNLNKGEVETQIRKLTRAGRIISGLEDIANKKRPLRSGAQRDKLDAQERAMQKELREAMKDLPAEEGDLGQELKTQLDSAKQRVQNQIDDLEREINNGELVPKDARTVTEDAELKALKEKRDALKKEHDAIFKDEDFKQARRLELTKKANQRRIDDLKRRLKEGDFSKKERKPLISDSELIKIKAEKLRIQEQYDVEFYKNQLANRTTAEKWKDRVWEMWSIPRALMATGEWSFVGVQGLINTVAHPKDAAKAFNVAWNSMLSEKKTEQFLNEIKSQEWYPTLKNSKLSLTEPKAEITAREETFNSGWSNLAWNLIGTPVKVISENAYERWTAANPMKALERASVGYLDTQRVLRFLDGMQTLKEQGKTFENSPQDYKDMADVINTFTGRASLGKAEQIAEPLSKIFFSPRNWASAFKTGTPYAFYHFGKMTPTARKMAISDFSKFVGLTTSGVMLSAVYLNNDGNPNTGVEFDPRSTDFMKIKLGNIHIDPWGGRQQQIVFTARMVADMLADIFPDKIKGGYKNSKGDIIRLGEGNYPTKAELGMSIAMNKLSPSAALFQKYMSAELKDGKRVDKFGKPFDLKSQLSESTHPIFWSTVYDLYKDDPSALNGMIAFYTFFGGGVSIYDSKPKK